MIVRVLVATAAVLLATVLAAPALAQATPQPPPAKPKAKPAKRVVPASDRCVLEIVNVDRQGVRTTPTQGTDNYYAGGNVHFRCIGRAIDMYSDSVASYGGRVVQFISQGNRVRYRDSTASLDADFGTYFKDGERFEAQGNVVHTDLKNGSTIKSSQVNYLRPLKGVRPDLEVIGYNRPTVTYVVTDSAGKKQSPYVIVGNLVRILGSDAIYAGGAVTIDREDLKGTGDSLWLDSGKKQGGQLIGRAVLRNEKDNGFTLSGKSIDIGMRQKELSSLKGRDPGKLVSKDITLDADSVEVELARRTVEVTRAWGKTKRPAAVSSDFKILGDSLRIETPQQRLDKVRAYGKAWAGGATTDTTVKGARRDWISGEQVVATFVERDSAGVKKTTIQQLEAQQNARSFYQMAPEKGQTKGSTNYMRANRILVTMRITRDSTTVDQVIASGNVDGVNLQPAVKRDSTRRKDTTGVRPVPGGRP